jgi:hypothetical protein
MNQARMLHPLQLREQRQVVVHTRLSLSGLCMVMIAKRVRQRWAAINQGGKAAQP